MKTLIKNKETKVDIIKPRLDTIKITGEVVIIQGGKVVRKSHNHFVGQGLINIINALQSEGWGSTSYGIARGWGTSPFTYAFLVLGTDTTTVTGHTMTALVAPIGAAPGTKANSQSGSSGSPSSGVWEITYTATWNAGTISGVIGELGLYLAGKSNGTLNAFGVTNNPDTGVLHSRLSVADGDFTAYTIDTTLPLTVQWRVRFTFA